MLITCLPASPPTAEQAPVSRNRFLRGNKFTESSCACEKGKISLNAGRVLEYQRHGHTSRSLFNNGKGGGRMSHCLTPLAASLMDATSAAGVVA
jgi:hypothetical protein